LIITLLGVLGVGYCGRPGPGPRPAAATIFIALVICWIDLTVLILLRISRNDGIT